MCHADIETAQEIGQVIDIAIGPGIDPQGGENRSTLPKRRVEGDDHARIGRDGYNERYETETMPAGLFTPQEKQHSGNEESHIHFEASCHRQYQHGPHRRAYSHLTSYQEPEREQQQEKQSRIVVGIHTRF